MRRYVPSPSESGPYFSNSKFGLKGFGLLTSE